MEPCSVGTRREFPKGDLAALEEIEDEPEVFELLVHDLGHRPGEVDVVDIGEQQVHRHARGLLLTVGVVDEHLVEMGVDLG